MVAFSSWHKFPAFPAENSHPQQQSQGKAELCHSHVEPAGRFLPPHPEPALFLRSRRDAGGTLG